MKIYKAWVAEFSFPGHFPVIALRVAAGAVGSSEVARRATGALLLELPLERLAFHLAVPEGELAAEPKLFGSTQEAEALIRSSMNELHRKEWRPVLLSW
ncbi:hypothetical protein [Bradyrhizobium japonicum]|uniref:hypothetical protein n=1 Tax=Bradyrhizobium japonicum TaxID=375 RepID=UPI0012BC9213|nr:hypothetical protein [Bradyrhizobium japonicum]